jgi:UDP-GlcNAc3NAcA epimerase
MSTVSILSVVGARPQFVKAAMVSRAIAVHNRTGAPPRFVEELVHTGQHYDPEMSEVFFEQMGIPRPAVNLEAGSGSHAEMTGTMLMGLEREIAAREPHAVLLYGDTNSTVAGALAAAKLHIPVAHVEAGLRSFNRRMPEEVNRVLTDHVSSLLFCPTSAAVANLRREGIREGVHHVGDVMYDAALAFRPVAEERSDVLRRLALEPCNYHLATMHRAENTNAPGRLRAIFAALATLARRRPVVLPLHPRTRQYIRDHDLEELAAPITLVDPVPFLDMVRLEQHARVILTDSGGVQKEAYFHGVPCVTLRDETEWVETLDAGWNQLVGADTDAIIRAAEQADTGGAIDEYGNGHAAEEVVKLLACDPSIQAGV